MPHLSLRISVLAALLALPAGAQTVLPLNQPTTMGDVTAVCTGVGSDQDSHTEWLAYPLKIMVVGKDGQYLADADVTIAQGRKTVADVHCEAPWILAQLAPGRYRVTARYNGQSVAQTATAPTHGQGRVILRFPNRGGAVSAEHAEAVKEQ
ncbi:MAG: hypothetical protein P4L57_01455 [Rhizomicrobium sp.]|nr:hypothetical protein [Rhizomicrobium sp.]